MVVESETTARGRRLGRNPEGAKRVEGRGSWYNHTNVAAVPSPLDADPSGALFHAASGVFTWGNGKGLEEALDP